MKQEALHILNLLANWQNYWIFVYWQKNNIDEVFFLHYSFSFQHVFLDKQIFLCIYQRLLTSSKC